jgi:hypothetical protein
MEKTFSGGVNKVVIGTMPIPAKMATLVHDANAHAGLCKTWAAFLLSLPDPFNEPDALGRISGSYVLANTIRGTGVRSQDGLAPVTAVTELNAGMDGFGRLTLEVTI